MDRVYTMELVRSFQVGALSRRDFLTKASTALGSTAAASLLLAACTPVTGPTEPVVLATQPSAADQPQPTPGVIAEMISYPDGKGGTLTGYLARPAGEDRWPAVVVIQEWWGLNDHIKDIARRFAAEGIVALAPELQPRGRRRCLAAGIGLVPHLSSGLMRGTCRRERYARANQTTF